MALRTLTELADKQIARAIQTVLRSSTGEQRQAVIDALISERDTRVVPMLVRILEESDPLGRDHRVVLDTLGALKIVHTGDAVRPIDTVMRRKRWFARKKNRALKERAVEVLASSGTDTTREALSQAAKTGDRTLRKIARNKLDSLEVRK